MSIRSIESAEPTEPPVPDRELVRRLDVAAPRYTSYPTIPVWDAAPSDERFLQALQSADSGKPVSLYLHVPFCPSICHYCGCNSRKLRSDEQVHEYVERLGSEIRRLRVALGAERRVVQLHFGGGTPTVLDGDRFQNLFDVVLEGFSVDGDAEIAIETNPMTLGDDTLELLGRLGFNRFSVGVQDLDPVVQRAIGRNQTFERTAEVCRGIRGLEVNSLNFDLVYGLPFQTQDRLARTLERVVDLRPDRIAVYSFAYLPRLRDNQRHIDAAALPRGDEKFDLYLQTVGTLRSAGYEAIGMDHFALPDDELARAHRARRLRRNFMGYTTTPETDVLAVGATAISDLGEYYGQNLKGVSDYERAVDHGRLPVMREIVLDDDDRRRRRVIMSLLCNGVIVKSEIDAGCGECFDTLFEPELERLEELEDEGLVSVGADRIIATDLGRYFLRNIAVVFDNYFDGRKGESSNAVFSRTV